MKKLFPLFLLMVCTGMLFAQFSVVSVQPANNAVNVSLLTTVSITFTEAIDTNAMNNDGEKGWYTNIDSTVAYGYSADQKTAWSTHVLKPNTAYFYAFSYVKAKSGALITSPHVYYFTTGATFPPYSVSGTLSGGSSGISPAGSVVALSTIDFMNTQTEGPPPFAGWANVNANGTYTIPYVSNGTYWPLAAKDVNGDGMLDPGRNGDVVVMGAPVVVNNAPLTNVDMTFFSVVSVSPANLSTNVPLNTTISITFSEPLDTNAMMENGDNMFSSVDSVTAYGFSNNGKTLWSAAVLKPNTTYFIAFTYVKARSGSVITTPQIFYFTTGAAFPATSVSGTVSSGSTGVPPEGAIVGLATMDFVNKDSDGPPPFGGWSQVNANGTFTIPYVPNGTYWPLAAKDVNHDGQINPDNGIDVMALGDSIVVNNASVTGLQLTFFSLTPKLFHESIHRADSLAAANLPGDRQLKRISGWEVDTLGRSRGWEFAYTYNGNTQGKIVRVGSMDYSVDGMDMNYLQWMMMMKPIPNYQAAASSATVIANVEAAGGRQVRLQQIPSEWEFRIELSMSDQKNGWFGGGGPFPPDFDTSKIYWAVAYAYNRQISNDQNQWMGGKLFLCDLMTGAVLKTQQIMMGVKDHPEVPAEYTLSQNYPNPFNPVTSITFAIPAANTTSVTVYDLLGQEVAVLVNEKKDAGTYTVPFNAEQLPSGVYFYRLQSGSFTQTKKMLLLK
jgi:methionine-rich copper-binding protein CopC